MSGTDVDGALSVNIASQLPSLATLLINSNELTGPMPVMPASLRALIAFDNDFTSMPSLQHMSNLTYAVLDGNRRMTGQLHEDWSAFEKLQVLSAQHCSLSGSVPTGLLHLSGVGQLRVIGLRDNLLQGALELLPVANMTASSSLTDVDLGMNDINGGIPATLAQYLAMAPALSVLRLDQNLLSCGLDGVSPMHTEGRASNLTMSVLAGNAFQCPVPEAVSALDAAAEAYTCDSAPWQLDLVVAAMAALSITAFAVSLLGKFAGPELSTHMWCLASLRSPVVRVCLLATTAMLLSLLHWGVLYPSVYKCAGGMWGSGAYHRAGSGMLLFTVLSMLAALQMLALAAKEADDTASCNASCSGKDSSPLGGIREPLLDITQNAASKFVCSVSTCSTGAAFMGASGILLAINLALDFGLAILSAGAWGSRSSLPVPHLLTVATAVTSVLKTVSTVCFCQ